MADESNVGPVTADPEAVTEVKTPMVKMAKAPRRQNEASEPAQPKTTAKPRRYSEHERNEKLQLIETQVGEGKSTLKEAIKGAGISEQTYYQWKRTAKPLAQKTEKPLPATDELADLIELEEETSGYASFWRKSCGRKTLNCARGSVWINPGREGKRGTAASSPSCARNATSLKSLHILNCGGTTRPLMVARLPGRYAAKWRREAPRSPLFPED